MDEENDGMPEIEIMSPNYQNEYQESSLGEVNSFVEEQKADIEPFLAYHIQNDLDVNLRSSILTQDSTNSVNTPKDQRTLYRTNKVESIS